MRTIVLGPPGTGKTTTLLNKVDDYLKQTDPDKIGYFAFTKKAAEEAKDRAIKKLDPEDKLKIYAEGKNPNTGGIFGKFFKDGPGIIQRGKNLINKVLPGDPMSKIQTPPLGSTPQPKLVENTQQIDPTTNLTRTETALLSPTEKVIAGRT